MLNKLEFYGIRGRFLQLIKTYLQSRYQRVVLNNNYTNSTSDWGKIIHGVPQGSVIGPLLFLLHTNDLPHSINENNKIVLFANDTNLIISNPDPINFRKDINKILQHIHECFDANVIYLNWEKTHFMQFSTKNNSFSNFDIIYKDKKLTTVNSIKFLGLTSDNSLSWKKHIEAIVPKLCAATFAIRVVQSFLPLDSLKLIYYSYFHSILTYRIIFWGNTHNSNTIFKMQKRIIWIMVGIRNRDSCREGWKYCHCNPNIFCPSCFLWRITDIISGQTVKSMISTQKVNLIYIHLPLNWQCTRGDHIIPELRHSIFCLPI